MKRYILFFLIALLLLIGFFLTQDLWVGNIVREAIIKEVIPYELSKMFSIPWERVSIIESKDFLGGYECFFFVLFSEKRKDFFIATIFDPSEKMTYQLMSLKRAENFALGYLLEIVGLEKVNFEEVWIIRSKDRGFLVLCLQDAVINGRPFKEYL